MRKTTMAAAGLILTLAAPALAQMQPNAPQPPMMPAMGANAVSGTMPGSMNDRMRETGGLPGVGMRTTTSTERQGSGGPGGLSGGVGAAGVPAPGLLSGAPNATTAPGSGITFETTPGVPTR